MTTNYKSNTNDVADLVKLGFTTGYYIAQMARYKTQYVLEKESNSNNQTSVPNENKDNTIKYACLAGIGIIGLLAFGIASLKESNRKSEAFDSDWDD